MACRIAEYKPIKLDYSSRCPSRNTGVPSERHVNSADVATYSSTRRSRRSACSGPNAAVFVVLLILSQMRWQGLALILGIRSNRQPRDMLRQGRVGYCSKRPGVLEREDGGYGMISNVGRSHGTGRCGGEHVF